MLKVTDEHHKENVDLGMPLMRGLNLKPVISSKQNVVPFYLIYCAKGVGSKNEIPSRRSAKVHSTFYNFIQRFVVSFI